MTIDNQHLWIPQVSSRTLFVPWDEAGTLCPVGDFFNYACPGVSYGESEREVDVMSEDASDASGGLELRDRLRDGGFEPQRNEYCFYARQDYKKGQQVNKIRIVITNATSGSFELAK